MNTKVVFCFLVLATLSSCYKEEVFLDAKGKIKQISTYYEREGVTTLTRFFYNEAEILVKKVIEQNDVEFLEIAYEYNSRNQLIREEGTGSSNPKLILYEYDSVGRLVDVSGSGVDDYELLYDSLNRKVSKRAYTRKNYKSKTKNYIYQIDYKYDSIFSERIIEESIYFDLGQNLRYKLKYDYDLLGNLEYKRIIDGMDYYYREVMEFFINDGSSKIQKILYYELNYFRNPGLKKTETYYYFE